MEFPTLCPLVNPLKNSESPEYLYIKDTFHCERSGVLTSAFGMKEFDENGRAIQYNPFGSIGDKIWEDFKIDKILNLEQNISKSTSKIAFATHKQTQEQVVIKAFLTSDINPEDRFYTSNLMYEIQTYQKIKDLNKAIPLFGTFVAEYSYINKYTDPPNEQDAALCTNCVLDTNFVKENPYYGELLREVYKKYFDSTDLKDVEAYDHTLHFLVTKKLKGQLLFDYLNIRDKRSPIVLKSILFQILFALHAMFNMGFQHNDLHASNIMVDTNPDCKSALFFIEGKMYDVPTPVKITIFDFDNASCSVCGENEHLDHGSNDSICLKYGVCNKRNSKYDLYTILTDIHRLYGLDKDTKTIIKDSGAANLELHKKPKLTDSGAEEPEWLRFYSPDYNAEKGEPVSVELPAQIIAENFKSFEVPKTTTKSKGGQQPTRGKGG